MQIQFEVKRWMKTALVSIVLFVASYIIAATFPECHQCRVAEVSAIQVWWGIVMALALAGAVLAAIVTLLSMGSDW